MLFSDLAARAAHPPSTPELPLLHTSAVRRLAVFSSLLALGSALACYQEKPAAAASASASADTTHPGASNTLGLQPLPASHDTAIREIDRFVINAETLQRLAAAKRNVSALYTSDPGVDARMRGKTAPKDLNEMVERIDAEPGMKTALQQAGLSARDYMISMVALQQAVKGYQLKATGKLDVSRVPPVVMSNIDFVGSHMGEIMQTMMASGARTPAAPPAH